jgi:hypothetical protein
MEATSSTEAKTFMQFYESYLCDHASQASRIIHFLCMLVEIGCILIWVATGAFWFLPVALLIGYGIARMGNILFEKNRSNGVRHPVYSFLCDWRMFWELLTRQIKF